MTTFKRSMEAHEIEQTKWQVLLVPQLTGKARQTYAALSSEDSKNFVKVYLSVMILTKKLITRGFDQLR